MASVRKVLILGGGIAGMSLAISLRKIGVAVDLVELDPEWKVYGAGITITAPTLRAFVKLGVIDGILAEGACTSGFKMCDAAGNVMATLPTPSLAGEGVPGTGGILRPALHRILSDAVRAAGVSVTLGAAAETIAPDGAVTFTDGRRAAYDLVVGADGLNSKVRTLLFPEAPKPAFTGQGCWRVVAPRPAEIDTGRMYMAGAVKAGLTPISDREMYLFFLQPVPGNPRMDPEKFHLLLAEQLKPFGGAVGVIRDRLGPSSNINYRPLESVLVPPPWHKGRVVLIGDAAHATTPHLASGAGIAVEDALVLTELLAEDSPVEATLARFSERRYPRCALVVNNSLKLGELEMAATPFPEYAQVMGAAMAALAGPM